jgi:hypothetical protein
MQDLPGFRIIISDQTEDNDVASFGEVRAAINVLGIHGHDVQILKHLPRKGMAEQRQFLLDQAEAPYILFIDDDLILEPWATHTMLSAIEEEGCGFVGMAVIGLSFINDVRPLEQGIEFWKGPVNPEIIELGSDFWNRYRLHNAANLFHVQDRLNCSPQVPCKYKVAWIGGCTLYNTSCLQQVGGFSFWKDLPPNHSGEDVLAQWRVMARYGGCGILPSGVYHQELPTTIPDRQVDAPRVISLLPQGW